MILFYKMGFLKKILQSFKQSEIFKKITMKLEVQKLKEIKNIKEEKPQ